MIYLESLVDPFKVSNDATGTANSLFLSTNKSSDATAA